MSHLKTDLDLGQYSEAHVSTIDLTASGYGRGIETCLFFNGGSEVVATYRTWEEAVEGHKAWANYTVFRETVSLLREIDRLRSEIADRDEANA